MAGHSLEPGQTGPAPNQRKRKAAAAVAATEDETESEAEAEAEAEELESVEELEKEVADLDRRILAHVHGTATRLSNVLSRLEALRPLPRHEIAVASETSIAEANQALEKLEILQSKVKAYVADRPKVLEKLNETIARCEKFMNLNVDVDFSLVFRRKL